jgi:hypothetical protein
MGVLADALIALRDECIKALKIEQLVHWIAKWMTRQD